jgi:vitamin B12/bleomycin/antimicrobial peptide transport system ATP-binding/permease protein
MEQRDSRKDATKFSFRSLWRLLGPYWWSEERWLGRGLLAIIVALNLGLVYVSVLFNEWNRLFYDSLQNKDYEAFKAQLLRFTVLALIYIAVAVYRLYLSQMLEMRWRRWLTKNHLERWMTHQVYYRMEIQHAGTDNPDQRIAEDLRLFTNGALSLSLGLLSAVVTLVSFVGILWSLSGDLSFSLFGRDVFIPAYMVWAALIYSFFGSFLTHWIGKALIGLNFQQQRFEADFRFNLVRVRENAEGIALYRGEASEQEHLDSRFIRILRNWWEIMKRQKRLTWYTATYAQIAIIFPILVAAPRYFAGTIQLGGLMQIASAFGNVQTALSWFIDNYRPFAEWKASVDRLTSFHDVIFEVQEQGTPLQGILVSGGNAPELVVDNLHLGLPDGRILFNGLAATITPGERLLVRGPSGAGKSTLFRAIAGIWPFGSGNIRVPRDARKLFLPQKPYLPIGTLRDAITYPEKSGAYSDSQIVEALQLCRLGDFVGRLDESAHWEQVMSPGEQQRLAFARALLYRPAWLFLDEATAALDDATQDYLYSLLQSRLPGTSVVSIAHRADVKHFHTKVLSLQSDGSYRFERLQAEA